MITLWENWTRDILPLLPPRDPEKKLEIEITDVPVSEEFKVLYKEVVAAMEKAGWNQMK